MADFDPSTYLAQVKGSSGPQFDPNQYLAKMGKPPVSPDAGDKAAHPLQEFLDPKISSADNAIKMSKINPSGFAAKTMRAVAAQTETPTGVQQLGTTLLPGPAAKLAQGAGPLGKLGIAGLMGGTTAVGTQDPDQTSGDKLASFLKGGVIGGAIQGAGSLAGAIGDRAMQYAVGMRKAIPGVGTSLAEQGVVGTKAMMQNQVENKLAGEESKLQDLVKNLQGTVNSKEIADAVSNKAEQFTLPDKGVASPFSQVELSKVRDTSDKLSQMGDLSARDLLALKRQGDYQGYTMSGTPATSTEASLGRAGANAARTELKKMSPDVADSLYKEKALIAADKGLNKPETLHQGLGSKMIFGKAPGMSLLESLIGQAGVQGSKAVTDPRLQRAAEQGLFGQ